VALFIVFAGALIFSDPPLTAVQMLWVNLIMDTFAALALATEPPSDQLLDRQPVSRFEKIVNATMWRNIIDKVSIRSLFYLLCYSLDRISSDCPLLKQLRSISTKPT